MSGQSLLKSTNKYWSRMHTMKVVFGHEVARRISIKQDVSLSSSSSASKHHSRIPSFSIRTSISTFGTRNISV
jgi:hypothetical protein